ncbi:MAG TPA: hypothetical protein VLD59_09915 [Steroidobacteraceae bacterium]|nr:hypothetical protein [Steroidobacteraceae bacterium]
MSDATYLNSPRYVYIRSEPTLYTVGFYGPEGAWNPESDHAEKEAAAERVAYLNGSHPAPAGRMLESLRTAHTDERLRAIVFEWCRLMNLDPWGSVAHSPEPGPDGSVPLVQLYSTRWQYLMPEARAAVAWAQAILLCPPETRFPHGD